MKTKRPISTPTNFSQPQEVDDVTLAFPAGIQHLMPPYSSIPDEFKRGDNVYCLFQKHWFFHGLKSTQIPAAKPGIDRAKAMRHLSAIQGSYEPKHEHKKAAVAYLANLWLEEPSGAEIRSWDRR